MCFLVDCFLFAFSFVQSTFPTFIRFIRFVWFEISLICQLNRHACHREVIAAISNLPQPIAEEIEPHIASLPHQSHKRKQTDQHNTKRQRK